MRITGERQAHRPVSIQQNPAAMPAQLVTGTVHDQSVRGEPGPHGVPGVGDGVRRVLAQHIERAHQYRAQPSQLESAEGEFDAIRPGVAGRRHPFRIDLQTDYPNVGPDGAQPGRELDCGDGESSVTEVDSHRSGAGLSARIQRRVHAWRTRQPPVGAT